MSSHKKIAVGAFGCILKPQIQCNGSKILNPGSYVSKIGLKHKGSHDNAKNEFEIGKVLQSIDPTNNFFLYGEQMCNIVFDDLDNKTKKLVEKCFVDKNKGKSKKKYKKVTDTLSNIIIKEGLSFIKIVESLWNEEMTNVFKILGHILLGAKLALDNNISLMDIKECNFLFLIKENTYIHPVHIDFSDDYIVDFQTLTLATYLYNFSREHPTYNIWTPEERGVMMQIHANNNRTIKKDRDILKIIEKDEKTRYDKYATLVPSLNDYIPFEYFYDENEQQKKEFEFEQSLSYVKRGKPKEVVEKLLVWKIAEALTRSYISRFNEFENITDNNDPRKIYMQLLMKMKHPNILQRLDIDSCLSYIDYVLDLKSNNDEKYFIKMTDDILLQIMKNNDSSGFSGL